MDRIDRVSIVGMGAMGILYGDFLPMRWGGSRSPSWQTVTGPGGTGIPRYIAMEGRWISGYRTEPCLIPRDRPSCCCLLSRQLL